VLLLAVLLLLLLLLLLQGATCSASVSIAARTVQNLCPAHTVPQSKLLCSLLLWRLQQRQSSYAQTRPARLAGASEDLV
jgi:hypothetical protein